MKFLKYSIEYYGSIHNAFEDDHGSSGEIFSMQTHTAPSGFPAQEQSLHAPAGVAGGLQALPKHAPFDAARQGPTHRLHCALMVTVGLAKPICGASARNNINPENPIPVQAAESRRRIKQLRIIVKAPIIKTY